MKASIICLVGLLRIAIPLHAQEVSTIIEPPADAVIAIHVPCSGVNVLDVQTRNMDGDRDNNDAQIARGIGQSFQWNSNDKLHGLGLLLHNEQSAFPWSPHHEQQYLLHICKGDGPALTSPRSEIATYTILISGSLISNTAGGTYLYIEGLDLTLENGGWYGFQLAPAKNSFSPMRLLFNTSDTSHPGNSTVQNVTHSGFPYEDDFSNNFGVAKDFGFFLTAKETK